MKKTCFIYLLLSVSFAFAQKNLNTTNAIAEAEMKSAANLMNLKVNPNTSNYDITYHKLEFIINPAVYFITGKVTTTFKALNDMTTVTFDLSNQLTVSSVKKGTASLNFTQNANNELVISLPTIVPLGNSETVEINYSGAPPTDQQTFTQTTHNGSPIIWTLSEPFGARDWWPCKQDLNDKVDTIDVYITAPSQYISVSNGIETSSSFILNGNKTTHFHHGYPIPAYLVAIACTNYSVYNQTGGTTPSEYPIINYIYPEDLSTVQPQLAQTPPILNLYESLFEIYPFHNEKYGHAQFGWGGGMEHTTVSFMVGFDRQLIAHEMAHQWFGDKVTCGSWKDIWLNEGFATYLADLVIENFDGKSAFVADKTNMINYITSSPNGAVYLTDAEATSSDRIFSSRLSYDKGAMVLEMLRFKLGDAVFFQGIKNYLADTKLAYKYATTADLQTHLEQVYGQSLSEFFNDWVYNQGYPTYTITTENLGAGQAKFTVHQTQSDPSVSYFEMPIPVSVFGANGEQVNLVLNNTFNGETFTENVPFTITSILFDPEKHLISKSSIATLGLADFELNNKIAVYPNPSDANLHIELADDLFLENIIIYNYLGQKIMESSVTDFAVNALSKGVYTIEILTSAGTSHKKIIKN